MDSVASGPTFTRYSSKSSTRGQVETLPWDQWVKIFSSHDLRGSPADSADLRRLNRAKDGPAVIFGEVRGKRSKARVVRSHAIGLDLEAPLPDPESSPAQNRRVCAEYEAKIERAFEILDPFEYAVWTTHKSGAIAVGGGLRLRVVLPFAAPIEPADYLEVWLRLNRMIGGINDPATKDASRLNFLPSTFDLDRAAAWRHPGRWISTRDLPEAASSPWDTAGVDHAAVDALLRKIRGCHEAALGPVLRAIAAGAAFASPGDCHSKILQVTWWLASRDPRLSAESLRFFFAASFQATWPGEDIEEGVQSAITAYGGAVKKIEMERAEKKRKLAVELHQEQAGKLGPYSAEDLERIAAVQRCMVEDLQRRWIVTKDGTCWFLGPDGAYHGPHTTEIDVKIASRQILARSPVRLRVPTKTGYLWRPLADVATEAGQVAELVVVDLIEDATRFDPKTKILHEAVRPLRDLKPEFNEEIDRWLRILACDCYPKILDWMACAPDLGKLLCAIYFDGPAGSGKTLFATGIARLWTEGSPGSIDLVLSDFNDEISRCPLILADEEIPKRWRSTVTTQLRSLLSTLQRTLTRKYRAPAEMRGAVRLILTANNEFLLDSKDVSTQADIDAIAQRFLYVRAPWAATEYLNAIPRETRERWATEGIARHALWLRDNHAIEKPGARFWVSGDVSAMHQLLIGGSYWNSFALEWCVGYAMDPTPYDAQCTGLVRRQDGHLLVNVQAIVDGWSVYIATDRVQPTTAKMASALRAISTDQQIRLRYQGERIRYREVSVEMLLAWSDRIGRGDRQTILKNLGDPSVKELQEDEENDADAIEEFGSLPSANGVPF